MSIYSNAISNEITTTDGYSSNLFDHFIAGITPISYNLTTGLFNLVDEMLIDVPNHFNQVDGVHFIEDDFSGIGLTFVTSPITDYNAAYDGLYRIKNAMVLHAANGTSHGMTDDFSFASIGEMPSYGDVSGLVNYANVLKDAWNVHIATINDGYGTIHNIGDTGSNISSSDAIDTLFNYAIGMATLKVLSFDSNNAEGHTWEQKFSFYLGSSGDLSFLDLDSIVTILDQASFNAGAWTIDTNMILKNIVIEVTGETGKTITWTGKLEYDLNFFTP